MTLVLLAIAGGDVEPGVAEAFSAEEIARARELDQRKLWAFLVRLVVELAMIGVFVATRVGRRSAEWALRVARGRVPLAAAIFWVEYSLLEALAVFPARAAGDLYAERAFGLLVDVTVLDFARSTAGELLLDTGLEALLIAFAFFVMQRLPRGFVVVLPMTFGVWTLVGWMAWPVWFAPRFATYEPLREANRVARVEQLVEKSGATLPRGVLVLRAAGDRHVNARLTGFGPTRTLVLFDSTFVHLTLEETASLVAHELGHARSPHQVQDLALSSLEVLLLCLLLVWLSQRLEIPLADPRSLPAWILVGAVLSFVLLPAKSAVRRGHEREADAYAVAATGDPKAFASSEKKLARLNLPRLDPHPLVWAVFESHPHTAERLRFAASAEAGMPASSESAPSR